MAKQRDYDAEVKRAEEKLERARAARDAHLKRKYVPIGQAFAEVFPGVLECESKTELREFAARVGRSVQASQGQAQPSSVTQAPSAYTGEGM